jgi:DNA-binding PadR family transcriptional regulator
VSPTARVRRSLLAFLVLNLLAEAPRHPYEMKRLIHWRGKDQFLSVNLDSLYHAIAQLERAGLIEPVATGREGRRPERTVYRATESGLDELQDWMRDLLVEPTNEFPRVVAALAHLAALTPAESRELLERRGLLLEAQVAAFEVGLRGSADLPRVFVVEAEYALALRRAELTWLRSTIEDLRDGRLTWDREELLRRHGGAAESKEETT